MNPRPQGRAVCWHTHLLKQWQICSFPDRNRNNSQGSIKNRDQDCGWGLVQMWLGHKKTPDFCRRVVKSYRKSAQKYFSCPLHTKSGKARENPSSSQLRRGKGWSGPQKPHNKSTHLLWSDKCLQGDCFWGTAMKPKKCKSVLLQKPDKHYLKAEKEGGGLFSFKSTLV